MTVNRLTERSVHFAEQEGININKSHIFYRVLRHKSRVNILKPYLFKDEFQY